MPSAVIGICSAGGQSLGLGAGFGEDFGEFGNLGQINSPTGHTGLGLLMQQNLYFLPDLQGHWSFRPIFRVSLMSLGSVWGSGLGLFCGMGRVDGIAFSCFRLRWNRRSARVR